MKALSSPAKLAQSSETNSHGQRWVSFFFSRPENQPSASGRRVSVNIGETGTEKNKNYHVCKKNTNLFILTSLVYILHVKFQIKTKPSANKSSKIMWSGERVTGFLVQPKKKILKLFNQIFILLALTSH